MLATMSIIDKISRQGPRGPQEDWDQTVVPVGRGAEGFDLTPDGKQLWAANAQDGTISVLDAADKKVVATLSVNVRGANRLKFTPDDSVAVIDLKSLEVAGRIDAGKQPDGLAWVVRR